MAHATNKRSRSALGDDDDDDITHSAPKRFRPSRSPLPATTALLTPHSVPSSPTGAAIWSSTGGVDLALVNERLLKRIQASNITSAVVSTSDADSEDEWRRHYATDDDDSSQGAGWDTPDQYGERSTPVTSHGSDTSDTADCVPLESAFVKKRRKIRAPSEWDPHQDYGPQHAHRRNESIEIFICEGLEDSSGTCTSRGKIAPSAPQTSRSPRRPLRLKRRRTLKPTVDHQTVASSSGLRRESSGMVVEKHVQVPSSTMRTRSGRVYERRI
ncbi:hypothetical protein Slin14017_G122190 [Septoria linicola]|nr:hypothetical protein Slin14017_G122190 [Septoria linicola]